MIAIMLLSGGPKASVSSQDVPLLRRFSVRSKRFATAPGVGGVCTRRMFPEAKAIQSREVCGHAPPEDFEI